MISDVPPTSSAQIIAGLIVVRQVGVVANSRSGRAERPSVESIQTEIDVYRKYSAFYGNVFYLMRRR